MAEQTVMYYHLLSSYIKLMPLNLEFHIIENSIENIYILVSLFLDQFTCTLNVMIVLFKREVHHHQMNRQELF